LLLLLELHLLLSPSFYISCPQGSLKLEKVWGSQKMYNLLYFILAMAWFREAPSALTWLGNHPCLSPESPGSSIPLGQHRLEKHSLSLSLSLLSASTCISLPDFYQTPFTSTCPAVDSSTQDTRTLEVLVNGTTAINTVREMAATVMWEAMVNECPRQS
jgi:hypothetical protein